MLDMDKTKSLIAFVGMRDPYPDKDEEPGPILSLLLDKSKAADPFGSMALVHWRDLPRAGTRSRARGQG